MGGPSCNMLILYKKWKLGHTTQRQKDSHVRTQQVRSHLQAKERGLRRNQICQHLDLGLLASRIVRNYISVVYNISLW